MQPSDIGRLVDVASPAVSPDGATVAFVVTRVDLSGNDYRSSVWLTAADGATAPSPLTSGPRDRLPTWSPDGRRLAFTRSVRTDKGYRNTVHVAPVTVPGETTTIAELPEMVESLEWSPDGSHIAYAARQRTPRYDEPEERSRPPRRIDRLWSRLDDVGWTIDRPTQVFVVPADGAADPVAVTSGPFEHGGPSWSPDGSRLVLSAARHEDWDLEPAIDLFVVDVDAALAAVGDPPEPHRVTKTWLDHQRPSWSPAGDRIATLVTDHHSVPRHTQLLVVDPESGATTELSRSLDRTCAPYPGVRSPVWDGDDLLFSIEDRGDVHVYRVPADGAGEPTAVVTGERWVTGYDLAGGTLAFTAGTGTELTDLFVVRDGEERRLTRFSDPFVAACPPQVAERFTVPSPGGGEIDAWFVRPAGFDESSGERVPLLLNIHGGPMTQYGNKFFDEFQLYASAGFAVVYCNPHGSTGFTEAWLRGIRSPVASDDPGTGWGGLDYEDIMAVVDATLERFPFVDGERMGVMGGSYGGYMTSWIVSHTDRFAAACSERAVNNLLTEETSCDIAGAFRFQFGFSHLDHPEELLRMSPITYVKDIRTPVLILHSENDLRCPVEQADQLFVALRLLRREVEYHRFTEEGHELTRSGWPRHRVQRAEIVIDWFTRKLGGRVRSGTTVGSEA